MDAFEKAIRSAFEKGDASDRAFREKVYRSAFAALDRTLQANPNITPEIIAQRRQLVLNKITNIETEFLPAVDPAVEPSGPAPDVEFDTRSHAPSVEREPSFDGPEPHVGGAERAGYEGDAVETPDYAGYDRAPKRQRSWVALVITAAVLAVLAIAAWWMLAPERPKPLFPTPPIENEDFSPDDPDRQDTPPTTLGSGDGLDDWTIVFDPADPTTVSAPGDSTAAVMVDDDERFMRISTGASGSPVLFDVGRGVLEQIAGRRAVFNIIARAEEGQETQISIECSLGELGDCGRKRYQVGVTREELLFELTLPEVEPGAGGTIAINPDIENGRKSVDIYAIRVSAVR